jgi:hypothetical protein
MKKRYNVSEFTSNSVFQEWFYVFTIQLGIRASPSATHYTSWTSSVMDEIKKPSEFSPGDWAAQSPSLLRCLQKFIVHSAGRSQGSQVKKEGKFICRGSGTFYSRLPGHTYHRRKYTDRHSGGIENLNIFNYI